MIQYKRLSTDEISRQLFKDFIRHQNVTKCWRKERGEWVVKEAPFVDDWTEEDYGFLVSCLKNTVLLGGFVYGAFCDGKCKGFVSVESEWFGNEQEYLDLSSIHISERDWKDAFSCGEGMGKKAGGKKAIYIRSFRCGNPGFLPFYGMC